MKPTTSLVRWLVILPALALASPVRPQSPTQIGGAGETIALTPELSRLTVPVMINGRGPFPFVVDTGAERTVISRDIAQRLGLRPGAVATVHSMTEVSNIDTVVIPDMTVGRRSVSGIHAPALDHRNLGAAGMLGIDSLQGQRVEFDFRGGKMQVVPSGRRDFRSTATVIAVKGRRHFGRLLLTDAAVDGRNVVVIVDSGSQITIGNDALRAELERKGLLKVTFPVEVTSITGGRIRGDYGIARQIDIGGLRMDDVPISFADVHPFRQLELNDRPALLLGMDVLRLFEKVSVDFPRRRVKFTLSGDYQGTIGLKSVDPTAPRLLQ